MQQNLALLGISSEGQSEIQQLHQKYIQISKRAIRNKGLSPYIIRKDSFMEEANSKNNLVIIEKTIDLENDYEQVEDFYCKLSISEESFTISDDQDNFSWAKYLFAGEKVRLKIVILDLDQQPSCFEIYQNALWAESCRKGDQLFRSQEGAALNIVIGENYTSLVSNNSLVFTFGGEFEIEDQKNHVQQLEKSSSNFITWQESPQERDIDFNVVKENKQIVEKRISLVSTNISNQRFVQLNNQKDKSKHNTSSNRQPADGKQKKNLNRQCSEEKRKKEQILLESNRLLNNLHPIQSIFKCSTSAIFQQPNNQFIYIGEPNEIIPSQSLSSSSYNQYQTHQLYQIDSQFASQVSSIQEEAITKAMVFTQRNPYQIYIGTLQKTNYINFTPIYTTIKFKLTIQQVSCGGSFTLFLTQSGLLYSSGQNKSGQLGQNDYKARSSPSLIATFKELGEIIQQISTGFKHSLVISQRGYYNLTQTIIYDNFKGKLYAWGSNQHGQLGLDHQKCVSKPSLVKITNQVISARAGLKSSIALTNERQLMMWGSNSCMKYQLTPREIYLHKYAANQEQAKKEWAIIKLGSSWSTNLSAFYAIVIDLQRTHPSQRQALLKLISQEAKEWNDFQLMSTTGKLKIESRHSSLQA